MRILQSNFVFPSYGKIKEEIIQKRTHKYEQKISRLEGKLKQMQQANDFQADHQKIKDSIIALSQQGVCNKNGLEKENLKWEKNHRYQFSHHNNFESLNYYIEDDKEEENNYETYLKFKKKALERDLEEDQPDHMTCQEKKRMRDEEEQLFKKLYRTNQDKETTLSRAKSAKVIKNAFQYKTAKQDASNFIRKVEKMVAQKKIGRQSKSNFMVKTREKEKEEGECGGEMKELLTYEKNKKFLTENYMDILKKLDSTNIVKWRILNSDQPTKQK